ncbi:MAG: M48 family metallopeptidase [bacterium]
MAIREIKIKIPRRNKRAYLKFKELARQFVRQRVDFYNRYYNYSYNRIFIKNQKTRWGSCSENRNLNFNYRIIFFPPRVADYIIVHELCHLKEMNHSKRYWAIVSIIFPDYKKIEHQLKWLAS